MPLLSYGCHIDRHGATHQAVGRLDDRDVGGKPASGSRLLRGADYVWLDEAPAEVHAGIGGFYAHVTAPLRRLIDRFATEVCLALSGGYEVPEWVRERAGEVVSTMRSTSSPPALQLWVSTRP